MKIYRFNPETGIYLGEDFTDEAPPKRASELPPDATTIAPPLVRAGAVPVFDSDAQCWVVLDLSTLPEMRLHGRLDQDAPAEKCR